MNANYQDTVKINAFLNIGGIYSVKIWHEKIGLSAIILILFCTPHRTVTYKKVLNSRISQLIEQDVIYHSLCKTPVSVDVWLKGFKSRI